MIKRAALNMITQDLVSVRSVTRASRKLPRPIHLYISLSLTLSVIFRDAPASASPTLDADITWGDGAQMSLVNPARTIDPLAGFNLSYDVSAPLNLALLGEQLSLGESLSGRRLNHTLYAGLSTSQRFALTLGYLDHAYEVGDRDDNTDGDTDIQRTRGWSVASAFKIGQIGVGVSALTPSRGERVWSAGVSAPLSSWLTTSIAFRDLSAPSLTDGGVKLGVGIKPHSRAVLGMSATPASGGGALEANAQLRLWRGLSLELGWIGYEGAGYLDGARAHPLSSSISSVPMESDPTAQSSVPRGAQWRFALSWRGARGLRFEHTASELAMSQLGVRLRSDVPTSLRVEQTPRVIIVNAQRAQEIAHSPSLLSATRGRAPFFELLRELDQIINLSSSDVRAVMITLGGALGWAQAEELSEVVLKLRRHGHVVYAYLPYADLKNYLVAAACDAIWASPSATLAVHGLSVERFYLHGLLERLDIKPEVIAAGEYKSAPEMFTRSQPSPEAEEVESRLLNARFAHITAQIARRAQQQSWAREPSPALTRAKRLIALRNLKENTAPNTQETARALEWLKSGPYSAKTALKEGLIDQLIPPARLEEAIRESFKGATIQASSLPTPDPSWTPRPAIAVIHAIGDIGGSSIFGRGGPKITASTYIPLIKHALYNPLIKGVVLRIDSPGGAITDADHLWGELKRLATNKPLAVSMGNIAASGGYYIAAPAHKIFASRSTLTGSIGVFMGKLDLSGALEKLGVNVHRAQRGVGGEAQSLFSPWTPQTRAHLKREIEVAYEMFLDRITSVRDRLSLEELKPLAGGRVWTGQEANQSGLIDVEGGLLDALKWVTVEAGLGRREHRVISLTPHQSPLAASLVQLLGTSTPSMETGIGTRVALADNMYSSASYVDLIPRILERFKAERAVLSRASQAAISTLELLLMHPQRALVIDPRL